MARNTNGNTPEVDSNNVPVAAASAVLNLLVIRILPCLCELWQVPVTVPRSSAYSIVSARQTGKRSPERSLSARIPQGGGASADMTAPPGPDCAQWTERAFAN